jgi:hypothetical protein
MATIPKADERSWVPGQGKGRSMPSGLQIYGRESRPDTKPQPRSDRSFGSIRSDCAIALSPGVSRAQLDGAQCALAGRGYICEETIEGVWGNADVRHAGMRWREHPGLGFVLEQNVELERASGRPLHTLRIAVPGTASPFAELHSLVDAARLACDLRAARWQTDAVRSIADRYVATGTRDVLPELRESLVRACCDDPVLLRACEAGTTWPLEHLTQRAPATAPLRRAPRPPIAAGVAHVHVPFAPLGATSVHTMIQSVRGAFEREGAGRIVSSSTEYGAQRSYRGLAVRGAHGRARSRGGCGKAGGQRSRRRGRHHRLVGPVSAKPRGFRHLALTAEVRLTVRIPLGTQ